MDILLDTSIFLWYISGNSALSDKHIKLIRNPENNVSLSVVSIWEIIIKQEIGKLSLPDKAGVYIPEQRIRHQINILDLKENSLMILHKLPFIHKDPFDRILICQAISGKFHFITNDNEIKKYDFPNII